MIIVDASPWPLDTPAKNIKDILTKLPSAFPHRQQAKEFFKQSVEKQTFSKTMADFLMASLEQKLTGPVKFSLIPKGF